MKICRLLVLLLLVFISLGGCKKYLDEKPDGHLEIPSTLDDFQALIDRYQVMNIADPAAGEVSCDDYYLLTQDYLSLSDDTYRNMYTWQKSNLFLPANNEWFNLYRIVFTANTIVEGLDKINPSDTGEPNFSNVKGQALFARGKALFSVASIWSQAYDPNTGGIDLGIPIRLTSDFNKTSVRANITDTYNQIISDLKQAISLLPVKQIHVIRSSKAAAYAMLARTYLAMRQYQSAGLYADSCLQLNNNLIDYNTLSATAAYPFIKFNGEVIYDSEMTTEPPINNTKARIDTLLYRSYSTNDLRKTLYYKAGTNSTIVFKGSYGGSLVLFDGLATDEMYLIRAECYARSNGVTQAMQDLNLLLSKRYKTGTFTNLTASSGADALNKILIERRKELVMRGVRWTDIKRLNKESANIILTRNVNGQTFILPPNDLRYALPIPDDIIQLTGMPQNPR